MKLRVLLIVLIAVASFLIIPARFTEAGARFDCPPTPTCDVPMATTHTRHTSWFGGYHVLLPDPANHKYETESQDIIVLGLKSVVATGIFTAALLGFPKLLRRK